MASRRRYLEQLAEMGESGLVLESRESGIGSRESQAESEAVGDSRLPIADSRSSKGPAMYPPGLSVDATPVGDMFTQDPVAAVPTLQDLIPLIEACRKCSLGHSRTKVVPGEGNPNADFVCVGEAPGATEDETGRPFVGRAGQLLNDILKAIGLAREDVWIMNVLKCRPPGNRDPEPMEADACSPYLYRQLELLRPKVILALGKPAATTLLRLPRTTSLGELREKVHRYRGTPLVVTYHPAALLRNPGWKAATWDDVRVARRILDGELATTGAS